MEDRKEGSAVARAGRQSLNLLVTRRGQEIQEANYLAQGPCVKQAAPPVFLQQCRLNEAVHRGRENTDVVLLLPPLLQNPQVLIHRPHLQTGIVSSSCPYVSCFEGRGTLDS